MDVDGKKGVFQMKELKEKILSTIALITVFVPLTVAFVWKPDSKSMTARSGMRKSCTGIKFMYH